MFVMYSLLLIITEVIAERDAGESCDGMNEKPGQL